VFARFVGKIFFFSGNYVGKIEKNFFSAQQTSIFYEKKFVEK